MSPASAAARSSCGPKYVTLQSVIAAAREASQPIIADYRHEFTVDLPDEPIWVYADPTRLAQVFSTCSTTPPSTRPPAAGSRSPWTKSGDEADVVAIHIRDNGIGIPADMLGQRVRHVHAGRPLARSLAGRPGHRADARAAARRAPRRHVEAHSDGPGKGSEFVIRLPFVADVPADGAASETAPPTDEPQGRVHRILAVDDNQDAVDILARTLQLKGHEVQTAYDGIEAVDVAARFKPDVVLLDIGLPRLNGYDVARRIRQLPGGKSTILIAITGWGQEEDRRQSQQSGFDMHLVKPVDPVGAPEAAGRDLSKRTRRRA